MYRKDLPTQCGGYESWLNHTKTQEAPEVKFGGFFVHKNCGINEVWRIVCLLKQRAEPWKNYRSLLIIKVEIGQGGRKSHAPQTPLFESIVLGNRFSVTVIFLFKHSKLVPTGIWPKAKSRMHVNTQECLEKFTCTRLLFLSA